MKVLVLLICGNMGVAFSYVIWSLFMKEIADSIGLGDFNAVLELFVFGILFLVFFFFINNFKEFFRRKLLFSLNAQLRCDLFDSILKKDINSFQLDNSAKYISVLNNDVAVIENDYFMNIPNIVENIITATIASVTLLFFHPLIALIVLIFSLVPMIIPKLYGDILSKSRSGLSESLEKYNAKIKDLFSGFELIKSFQIEDQTRKLHQEVTGHVETSRYNFRSRYSRSLINQDVLVYLSAIVQLCFSVYLVIKGQITFGVLLGSMQVSNYVSNPLKQIGEQVLNLKAANGIKEKIEQIINDETDVETINEKSVTIDRATPIVLEHVSFSYDGNKVNLSDINLQFHKGKKYAIVGSSGSGKSTLLKLVMNYFDTYEGKILLGNQLLSEIDKNSYYQHFSTIHQNVFMFDDTILNNITLFQKYSDEAVMHAVRRSGLEELVSLLPLGLETRINEGGNNLSGGEQQRIAIARALLRNSEVLLVDEATSSLDNELSMKIESLILAQNGLTAIVVTHKQVESLLCKYDYIIAMRDGAVEEFGTFDSLIEMNGYFRSLYEINR